jgi:hypothetical protein
MKRIATFGTATKPCDNKRANIPPGALIEGLVDIDVL